MIRNAVNEMIVSHYANHYMCMMSGTKKWRHV